MLYLYIFIYCQCFMFDVLCFMFYILYFMTVIGYQQHTDDDESVFSDDQYVKPNKVNKPNKNLKNNKKTQLILKSLKKNPKSLLPKHIQHKIDIHEEIKKLQKGKRDKLQRKANKKKRKKIKKKNTNKDELKSRETINMKEPIKRCQSNQSNQSNQKKFDFSGVFKIKIA